MGRRIQELTRTRRNIASPNYLADFFNSICQERNWRASLDQLVSTNDEVRRYSHIERLGGLGIDYKIEFGRLQYRQLTWVNVSDRGVEFHFLPAVVAVSPYLPL